MQKHYRSFTIGELLDMGLKVEVSKHSVQTDEEGNKLTGMFDGVKKTTHKLMNSDTKTYHAWKGKFRAVFFQ